MLPLRPAAASAQGPGATEQRDNPTPVDWVLAVVALVVCLYPVLPIPDRRRRRRIRRLPRPAGLARRRRGVGPVLLLLVLEACRRTTGWSLPAVCVLFLGYAYYGGYLPQAWPSPRRHRLLPDHQRALQRATGFYGVPLDVAATYIVLFTIYGAVLDALRRRPVLRRPVLRRVPPLAAAPGRTVTPPASCSARSPAPARRPR